MKKLIYCVAAMATVLFASCQKEVLAPVANEAATVSFSVNTPEIATRSYSDGTTATVLQYAVYDAAGKELTALTKKDATIKGSTTVELKLTTGNEYSVIFWAAAPNAPYAVDFANKTMTVDYTNAVSNDEARDAFYAYKEFTVNGAQTETIELRRPFAQLNIGTADYTDSENAGYVPTHSAVTVKNIFNTLNLVDGTVKGSTEVSFASAAINKTETFPVAGNEYLAMNYLLVAKDKEVVDVEFTYTDGTNAKTRTVGSVPVQRNYRTNIYGKLLTSEVDINVEIKPEYDEPAHESSALFNAAAFGGEVTLTEDVVLPSALMVQNNMKINLNGHNITITAEYDANNYEASSAIVNNATLVLTGKGEIKATNNYTIRNNSTMTIDGVTVKNGVMNFGDLTVESGNISNDRSGKHAIYGNAAKLTINGGVFHNENAGNAAIFAYAGEVVINGGEFTIADGTATLGWTSCLLDAQGGAKYIINYGIVRGEIRDYNKNTTVYGGVFSHSSVKNFVATGYKAVLIDGLYHVLSEAVANIVETNGVTAITESTADIATALATNNSEVTMFMWNDVAYIANYGEVVIASAADEATTVRGVVESAAGLTSATVAEGIEVIGNRTFRKCANLNTVKLPDTLTEIGPAVFQSCSKLSNVTIPAGVTAIGEGAFAECTSLESINIPAGVTRIESDCLRATGLKSVEFHAGVTYFGAQAFRDCKQLTEVIINAPEFTMESNTFGIMAAPYTPMTIHVANTEMKAYVESKLTAHAKTYITVVAPEVVNNTADLQTALAAGKNVILGENLTIAASEMVVAPYGNKTAVVHNGGVFDGNGKTINQTAGGDNYVIMTNGGTIKNVTINEGFRGIVVMSANQTVYLDNVVCSGEVCYALNTAEGDSTQDIVATDCTFDGWSSWSLVKSATFKNCSFGQGTYYTNVYGRLGKPYVNTLFDGCEFCSKYYIDLSALGADQKVTLKNCTVNGVKLTAQNWTSLVAPEDTCGEGQISIELKNGTYMTADNIADYIIFE